MSYQVLTNIGILLFFGGGVILTYLFWRALSKDYLAVKTKKRIKTKKGEKHDSKM
jgi:hypothetical protein